MRSQCREHLDGPKLVAWLEERFMLGDQILGFHARRVWEWREGGRVSVFAADPVLTKLDLRPDELPGDLWAEETPPRPLRVPHKISDEHLRALHGLHLDGAPINQLARRVWEAAGYASEDSASHSISRGFRRLGLPVGVQPNAVRCKGTKSAYPDKGRRCKDFPQVGSEYCWAHDPERRSEVMESTAQMRERLGAAA